MNVEVDFKNLLRKKKNKTCTTKSNHLWVNFPEGLPALKKKMEKEHAYYTISLSNDNLWCIVLHEITTINSCTWFSKAMKYLSDSSIKLARLKFHERKKKCSNTYDYANNIYFCGFFSFIRQFFCPVYL